MTPLLRKTWHRRSRPAKGVLVAAVLVTALSLVACGGESSGVGSTNSSTPTGNTGSLTIGMLSAPLSLDPAKDTSGERVMMHSLAYSSLTHLNEDGSISPGLAASWRYDGTDNTVFEMTLRKDAKFADGSPVNAAAVKAWLTYYKDAGGSTQAQVGAIKSIDTSGDWTVKLTLEKPNPILPLAFSERYYAGFVVGPEGLKDPARLGSTTDGAGQYVLDSGQTVSGDTYVYTPNKHYWDQAAIKFHKVVVKVISTPSTMLQAVRSGQVDVAIGATDTIDAAKKISGIKVLTAFTRFNGLPILDLKGSSTKALADPRVRQALSYAIDRQALVKGVFGENAQPTSAIVTVGPTDTNLGDSYTYDPAKAKRLLAEAGYPNGFSVPVVAQGYTGNLGTNTVQAVAQYWQAIGVTANVTTKTASADYISSLSTGEFSIAQVPNDSPSIWSFYSVFLAPKALFNPSGWTDKTLADIIANGAATKDPTADWNRALEYITKQALIIPLYKYPNIYYVSDRIQGVKLTDTGWQAFPTSWSLKK